MTQDIIEIAEGCGFTRTHTGEVQLWLCNKNDLERLVKLVAEKSCEEFGLPAVDILERTVARVVAKEREDCARVCESLSLEWADQAEIAQAELATMLDCAQAIRARSQP